MPAREPLDILFLSSWYPNTTNPTLGNFVERHARAISRLNRVHVIHTVPKTKLTTLQWHIHAEGGINTCILYHPAIRPHRLFRSFFMAKAIKHLQTKYPFQPDVVHHNVIHPAGRQALKFATQFNVPLVITEHWTGYHEGTHNRLASRDWDEIQRIGQAAHVLCPVTHHLARAMQQRSLQGRYITVPNVVDTECFTTEQKPKSPFTLLHVSSLLDVHKNVSGLLRAFRKSLDHRPNLRLEIIGDGELDPHRRYAHELGIADQSIGFTGASPIETIAAAMRKAHAVVLFSNYENLPCVIGEAFASGTPVLSTNVGGISEHLDESRGVLIEKGDEIALTEAIIALADQKVTFDAHALRQYAIDQFSEAAIAAAYDEVYRIALTPAFRD